MPGIPSEDACFFGGTPRNYALTIKPYVILIKYKTSYKKIFGWRNGGMMFLKDVKYRNGKCRI